MYVLHKQVLGVAGLCCVDALRTQKRGQLQTADRERERGRERRRCHCVGGCMSSPTPHTTTPLHSSTLKTPPPLHPSTEPQHPKAIRKEMQKIMRLNLPFIREEVSADEAHARISAINEPYKLEILNSIRARDPDAPITIYHIGEKDNPAHW